MEEIDEAKIERQIQEAEETNWHKVGNLYYPAKPTVDSLPPGYYKIFTAYGEIRFSKEEISTTGIFMTGSPNTQEIVRDVDTFWSARSLFDEYEVPYKRGIFLSGPPGSGKTCIIKLLAQKLIERAGAVLDVNTQVGLISTAVEAVRKIHRHMPLIIVMEDIDRWLIHSGPEHLMNIMDGITAIDGVFFIATANSTDQIDDAIIDRPGRFDVHYRVLPPLDEVRKDFIIRTLKSRAKEEDIDKWTEDTKDMPFGHIKELVISVVVFRKDYEKTLDRLRSMRSGQEEEDTGKVELCSEPSGPLKKALDKTTGIRCARAKIGKKWG